MPARRRRPQHLDRRLRADPDREDQSAEPTGFTFTGKGDTAFVFIQHSADDNDPMARSDDCPAPGVIAEFRRDDYCTDDLIRIRGFRVPRKR